MGGLCIAIGAIETFGLVAAITRRLKLIKTYMYLSFVNLGLLLGTIVLRIVFHFVNKSAIIAQCVASDDSDYYSNSPLVDLPVNSQSDCESLCVLPVSIL